MKVITVLATMLLCTTPVAMASEVPNEEKAPTVNVSANTRVDFNLQHPQEGRNQIGFHGRYLNLMINGNITDNVSYNFRQRLNKFGEMKNDVFGATDFMYVDWQASKNWCLSGGKQVVAIGGYEYDANPINIFYASNFWNNIACYQMGVSATYTTNNKNHRFLFQVCNSPYQPIGENCFAYNLMWNGKMGCISTIWSANAMQYLRDHFAAFLSLGTRADFDQGYFELDLMSRYSEHQSFFTGDYTVIGKLNINVEKVDIFAKGGYEKYRPQLGVDATVEKPFYGAGLEYYPLKNSRKLRLDLVGSVTHDLSGMRTFELQSGLTWWIDIYRHK